MSRERRCPRCKTAIHGYVEECPSCGLERPVALPWHIYAIMALILIAAMWFLVDLESIARAILGVREGIDAM